MNVPLSSNAGPPKLFFGVGADVDQLGHQEEEQKRGQPKKKKRKRKKGVNT
jgi:hypothetical protein